MATMFQLLPALYPTNQGRAMVACQEMGAVDVGQRTRCLLIIGG